MNVEKELFRIWAEEERERIDALLIDCLINGPTKPKPELSREERIKLSAPIQKIYPPTKGGNFYRIIERATGASVPCYFQFRGDQWNFRSIEEARNSNCHGLFQDKEKYSIAKFNANYECIEEECD